MARNIELGRAWALLGGMLAFCAAVSCLPASQAQTQIVKPDRKPMRIAIVRASAAECEPNCPEWISAEGRITPATPAKLRRVLKAMGKRQLPVLIQSPGGDVEAALEMGRLIKERQLDVAVAATEFDGCAPAEKNCAPPKSAHGEYRGAASSLGAYCASACPLVLAGGQTRLVGQSAFAGVHQIIAYYTKMRVTTRTKYRIVKGKRKAAGKTIVRRKNIESYTSAKIDKATGKALRTYLSDMGVSETLLALMQKTPAKQIYRLSPEELAELHLVTSPVAAETLIDPKLCTGNAQPGNCVPREEVSSNDRQAGPQRSPPDPL
jgi:hypothetical protein